MKNEEFKKKKLTKKYRKYTNFSLKEKQNGQL